MKLKIKYVGLVILDLLVLISNLFVAPILSIFTRAQPDLDEFGEPWGKHGKCIRIRLGWKLMTDKFERYGESV